MQIFPKIILKKLIPFKGLKFVFSSLNSAIQDESIPLEIDIPERQKKRSVIICNILGQDIKNLTLNQFEQLRSVDVILSSRQTKIAELLELQKNGRLCDIKSLDDYHQQQQSPILYSSNTNNDLVQQIREFFQDYKKNELYQREQKIRQQKTYFMEEEYDNQNIIEYQDIPSKILQHKQEYLQGYILCIEDIQSVNIKDLIIYLHKNHLRVAIVSANEKDQIISSENINLIRDLLGVEYIGGGNTIISSISQSGFPGDRFFSYNIEKLTRDQKYTILRQIRNMQTTAYIEEQKQLIIKLLYRIESVFGPEQFVMIVGDQLSYNSKSLRDTTRKLIDQIEEKTSEFIMNDFVHIGVVIAPYSEGYNSEYVEISNSRLIDPLEKNSEEQFNSVFINKSYKVNINNVARILKEEIDASDDEISQVLAGIFRIHKTKALQVLKSIHKEQ